MNKEERLELFFETISKIAGFEIKPDKEFYIVGNGKKSVYIIDEFLNLLYKKPNGYYALSDYGILPLFKGGYQLEEIKEPLLTEEEKEFLRPFKFDKLKKSNILYMDDEDNEFDTVIYLTNINLNFDRLKQYKIYSREELGL